jgi:hypothetical protein
MLFNEDSAIQKCFRKILYSLQVRKFGSLPAVRTTCLPVRTPSCPKLHLSGRCVIPSGQLLMFDQASGFLSKHRYGKIDATVRMTWIPVRTGSSIRQVSQFKSNRPDTSQHGLNACASDMEIACIRSAVWTTIPLVQTREASIWKLLAADMRPSGR